MTYRLGEAVLGRIHGPVLCVIDGKEKAFTDAQALLAHAFDKKYEVIRISAKNDLIIVELQESKVIPNDLGEDWVKEHLEKTGREISFF